MAQMRAEVAQLRRELGEMRATVGEMRDLLLQAKGGVALARWVFGGTLLTAIAAAAWFYNLVRNHSP